MNRRDEKRYCPSLPNGAIGISIARKSRPCVRDRDHTFRALIGDELADAYQEQLQRLKGARFVEHPPPDGTGTMTRSTFIEALLCSSVLVALSACGKAPPAPPPQLPPQLPPITIAAPPETKVKAVMTLDCQPGCQSRRKRTAVPGSRPRLSAEGGCRFPACRVLRADGRQRQSAWRGADQPR